MPPASCQHGKYYTSPSLTPSSCCLQPGSSHVGSSDRPENSSTCCSLFQPADYVTSVHVSYQTVVAVLETPFGSVLQNDTVFYTEVYKETTCWAALKRTAFVDIAVSMEVVTLPLE